MKEKIMNKMTKLGVSALCGSLAAVSAANAGDLSVTGGVDLSWISMDDAQTGNPIGMGSNYTLSGSGELDNGWGVALSIAMKNANAYSATNVTVTIPAIGDLLISGGVSGTGINRMDDLTPNVWEEAWGTGLTTGINLVAGASGAMGVEYTPNMLPDGVTARVFYTPDHSGSGVGDKAAGGAAINQGSGYDATLELGEGMTGMSGMTVYGGISKREQESGLPNNVTGDIDETTLGIKYAIGGFTLGYQWSEEDLGRSANEQQYDNDGYGITFAINDDLSIGYNHYESEQTSTTNVTAEATSYQIAYSMGGASIRLAEGQADNMAYQTTAAYDKDNTVLSIALAF
jgi:outer membrane protein OmpU